MIYGVNISLLERFAISYFKDVITYLREKIS